MLTIQRYEKRFFEPLKLTNEANRQNMVYRPDKSKTLQMLKHDDYNMIRKEWLEASFLGEGEYAHMFVEFENKFTETFLHFGTMWNVHLRQIDVSKHRITLSAPNKKPVHAASLRAHHKMLRLCKAKKRLVVRGSHRARPNQMGRPSSVRAKRRLFSTLLRRPPVAIRCYKTERSRNITYGWLYLLAPQNGSLLYSRNN